MINLEQLDKLQQHLQLQVQIQQQQQRDRLQQLASLVKQKASIPPASKTEIVIENDTSSEEENESETKRSVNVKGEGEELNNSGDDLEALASENFVDTRIQPHQCPVQGCGIRFGEKSQFRRHWRERHEKRITLFKCPFCQSLSKRRYNVTLHCRTVHPDMSLEGQVMAAEMTDNPEFQDPKGITWLQASSGCWRKYVPMS